MITVSGKDFNDWLAEELDEIKAKEINEAWEEYRFNQACEDQISEGLA